MVGGADGRERGFGRPRRWLAALAAVVCLAGCAVRPTHPQLRDSTLAPLVPVHAFTADVDYSGGFRLSPDGRRLVWVQMAGTRAGLATRVVDAYPATHRDHRHETGTIASWGSAGVAYAWLPDSRHVAFVRDPRGDENLQIGILDADDASGAAHVLTPWPGVRSTYLAPGPPGTPRFLFQSNRRGAAQFDVYEADAAALTVREVARDDGTVTNWIADVDGTIGARIRVEGDGPHAGRVLEVLERDSNEWRVARRFGRYGYLSPLRLDRSRGVLVATSGLHRNTTALVELDLATGRERELFRDARVDLTAAYLPPGAVAPYAVQIDPDYPDVRFFDAALDGELRRALAPAVPEPMVAIGAGTADRALRRLVVRPMTVRGEREYLFDRESGRLTLLRDLRRDDPVAAAMVPVEPVRFRARDGLAINGYLLRPRGAEGRRVPLVVSIHGGPWVRDFWEPSAPDNGYAESQLLANRGYAVLHVNYRGSTGYGGEHMYAAVGELGGRTQDDIEDAVRWAVARGIADPARVAVLGDSFGGFSVLAQLTRSPARYACGVDVVGIADWLRWLDAKPPYWRHHMHWWTLFLDAGDTPAGRKRLRDASPLARIASIRAPLLVVHGANDVRVARRDADEVVERLRALRRPVQYVLFEDEGHAIRQAPNRVRMWRAIEDFLAGCLGGRSSGFDAYEARPPRPAIVASGRADARSAP